MSVAPLFVPILLAWAGAWTIASLIGLWRRSTGETMRAFWFMSGLWAGIDILVGGWALLAPPESAADFVRLLQINAGLDVVYVLVGAALATRRGPWLRGFGWAIVVQGGFLLVYDLIWVGVLG